MKNLWNKLELLRILIVFISAGNYYSAFRKVQFREIYDENETCPFTCWLNFLLEQNAKFQETHEVLDIQAENVPIIITARVLKLRKNHNILWVFYVLRTLHVCFMQCLYNVHILCYNAARTETQAFYTQKPIHSNDHIVHLSFRLKMFEALVFCSDLLRMQVKEASCSGAPHVAEKKPLVQLFKRTKSGMLRGEWFNISVQDDADDSRSVLRLDDNLAS